MSEPRHRSQEVAYLPFRPYYTTLQTYTGVVIHASSSSEPDHDPEPESDHDPDHDLIHEHTSQLHPAQTRSHHNHLTYPNDLLPCHYSPIQLISPNIIFPAIPSHPIPHHILAKRSTTPHMIDPHTSNSPIKTRFHDPQTGSPRRSSLTPPTSSRSIRSSDDIWAAKLHISIRHKHRRVS